MSRVFVAALLTCAICRTAGAQGLPISDGQFQAELNAVIAQNSSAGKGAAKTIAGTQEKTEQDGLIGNVLVAMYDAPGTGELIVQWLRDHNAVVQFKTLSGSRSSSAWLGDTLGKNPTPAVYIDSSLAKKPVSYRVIGALIAKEASGLMLTGFTDSAERSYMIASRTAETYFELGGSRIELTKTEAALGKKAAEAIWLWVENASEFGVALLKLRGEKPLREILNSLRSDRQLAINCGMYGLEDEFDERIAEVERDLKTFGEFKSYESDWLMVHQGQLQ